MINLLHIKNIATYDSVGIELNNLNKINFIYGGNGCGKTTISNFLLYQNHPNEYDYNYSNCRVEIKNFEKVKILTYNKKFRDLNFYKDSDIPGVFTLGEATIEEVQLINSKTEELILANYELSKVQTQIKKFTELTFTEEKESQEKCWGIYKRFEENFKPALLGSGYIGSKANFRKKILSVFPLNGKFISSHYSLIDRTKVLFSSQLDTIQTIDFNKSNPLETYEKSEIWRTLIVGKKDLDISKLINDLNISDWVNHGRSHIIDSICPFCQKETIDDLFKIKLEEYFDNEFEMKVKKLEKFQSDYEMNCSYLILRLEDILENKSNHHNKLNIKEFKIELESLKNLLRLNIQLSREKLRNLGTIIELHSSSEIFNNIQLLIEYANIDILKHNQLVNSQIEETKKLTSEIWDFLAFEAANQILSHEDKIENYSKALQGMMKTERIGREKNVRLENELSILNSSSTSVQPAVDEINKLLKGFGFTNFRIDNAEKKNHYWIKRENGDNALHSLSEGESTFITFLYYLQVVKGLSTKDEVTTNKILVIDDPISSLDSNVLFIVSTLIKNLIKHTIANSNELSIKQIIILTHNVYFHKEISFQLQKDDSKHVNYWILRKRENITSIYDHGMNNPISTSYQMLWNEIKDVSNNSSTSLQNIIRRILENYFKILGNYRDLEIIDKFESFEEKKICQSLLHWINDGSHCIPDDLFIQPIDSEIDIYLKVFRKIFEESGHVAHYNMMMGITNPV